AACVRNKGEILRARMADGVVADLMPGRGRVRPAIHHRQVLVARVHIEGRLKLKAIEQRHAHLELRTHSVVKRKRYGPCRVARPRGARVNQSTHVRRQSWPGRPTATAISAGSAPIPDTSPPRPASYTSPHRSVGGWLPLASAVPQRPAPLGSPEYPSPLTSH